MSNATVFNIQKFSLHDGPGIRTTIFFKGCPLSCIWCHNPESLSPEPETLFNENTCLQCGQCGTDSPKTHRQVLTRQQIEDCPTESLTIAGTVWELKELLVEIEKDRVFYEQSGGGVTFSGGEPLMQLDALIELLEACKIKGRHTALDTCGYSSWTAIEKIAPLVDLFLYDLKMISDKDHKQFTGVSNASILQNLKNLSARGARIWLRLPIIPTINDSEDAIHAIGSLLKSLSIEAVHLLPYHNYATGKYQRLGKAYTLDHLITPPKETMQTLKNILENYHPNVILNQ